MSCVGGCSVALLVPGGGVRATPHRGPMLLYGPTMDLISHAVFQAVLPGAYPAHTHAGLAVAELLPTCNSAAPWKHETMLGGCVCVWL
jgi:hypothetical protein